MEVKYRRQSLARILSPFGAVVLVGCATTQSTCVPEKIQMPVTVPCVKDAPLRPASTFGTGNWPGDKAAAQAALADATAWEAYAMKLEVVLEGCR